MTFHEQCLVVIVGSLTSESAKRRYYVALSRIKGGAKSRLVIYDDPNPTRYVDVFDTEDD